MHLAYVGPDTVILREDGRILIVAPRFCGLLLAAFIRSVGPRREGKFAVRPRPSELSEPPARSPTRREMRSNSCFFRQLALQGTQLRLEGRDIRPQLRLPFREIAIEQGSVPLSF